MVPILADGDGLLHFRNLLDLRVDFRRPDAHAAGIERRVRPAVNDDTAVSGPLGEIAVAPDVRKPLEIGGVVFLAVGIVPEHHRHRRERLRADEFALLLDDVLSVVRPHIHRHAEARRRRFRAIPVRTLVPNVITLLALCAGLTAIRLSVEGKLEWALGAIVFAAILDGIDGRVARMIKGQSRFGAELDSLADLTALLVSELVTNALRHATGPIGVCLVRPAGLGDVLLVEVSDPLPDPPRERAPRPEDESGRGLQLVANSSRRWGTRPGAAGKTVWFELAVPG